MKKRISKILCIMLSLVFVLSFTFGCDNSTQTNGLDELAMGEMATYEGGLHQFEVTKRADQWILKDGTVNYTLVLPATTNTYTGQARSDFQEYFREATKRDIPHVYDDAVTSWSETDKYIVIGCPAIEEMAGLTRTNKLNLQGYQIVTKGDSIFIMAQNDQAAMFGAYELLTQLLNYEAYTPYYHYIDTNVTEIPMYDFNIIDNPDFEQRIGAWGSIYKLKTNANRMRTSLQHSDVYIAESYPTFHNTLSYLPLEEFYHDEYRDWYAQNEFTPDSAIKLQTVFQLCYTAHGKTALYNEMIEELAKRMIEELKRDQEHHILAFTQEDNTKYCQCDACKANTAKYGVISASMWIHLNDVTDKVMEWVTVNQPWRVDKLLIAMFAYQTYQQAPAKQDENGKWQPIDQEIVGGPNAAIFYAASTADYMGTFNSKTNKHVQSAIEGWKVCASNFGSWLYQTRFNDASAYLFPYDSFGGKQQNYKMLLDMGSRWIFDQGQQGNINVTAFNNFKLYLDCELQWNVNQSMADLENSYFTRIYGPASEIMLEFYNHVRAHSNKFGTGGDIDAGNDPTTDGNSYPYAVVAKWLDYCDQAYEAIEPLKATDPAMYKTYYDHICLESIMPRFLQIKFHTASVSEAQLVALKSSFKEDVLRLNITEHQQHTDINLFVKDF